ncbi:MAG: nucleotide exchange factor GrpE [Chloroflexi bacterium]|nr:nucleotide exchange factor GrpE [Chloroflexota bacterium]
MAPEQERHEATDEAGRSSAASTGGGSATGQQPAADQGAPAARAAGSGEPDAARTSATVVDDAEDVAGLREQIARLERELAEARERADRFHSNWQRSAADFQNWKRRTDQEKAELGRLAEAGLTSALLSVLDDFERGFTSLPPELRSFTWIEGMYLIGQKLFALLQARGLDPIEALGEDFDPHLHEAVLREEGSEGSDDLVVVQDLQRGYRFHERVIRATMVKVGARGTDRSSQGEPAEDERGSNQAPADGGGQAGATTDAAPG